jgi:hypothetical protein
MQKANNEVLDEKLNALRTAILDFLNEMKKAGLQHNVTMVDFVDSDSEIGIVTMCLGVGEESETIKELLGFKDADGMIPRPNNVH